MGTALICVPYGFGIEVEALYSRLGFDDLRTFFQFQGPPEIVQTRTLAALGNFRYSGSFA
jgi:hypothetical protein